MADDHGGVRFQRAQDRDVVGHVREHPVGLDALGDEGLAVAAHVDRDRPVPGGGERGELVAPRPRAFREAVDEQHQRPFAFDHRVDVAARNVDLHGPEVVGSLRGCQPRCRNGNRGTGPRAAPAGALRTWALARAAGRPGRDDGVDHQPPGDRRAAAHADAGRAARGGARGLHRRAARGAARARIPRRTAGRGGPSGPSAPTARACTGSSCRSRSRSAISTKGTSGCYVLDGAVRLLVGASDRVLAAGEAATFSTWEPHARHRRRAPGGGARDLQAVKSERGDHRARLRRGLVDVRVRAVEEVAAVHERRGPAAVEVDRVAGAERDQQPGELRHVQARVDARATAVAAHRQQLVLAHAQRGARVAADGDVGVELRGAGREALGVRAVDHRAPVADEQRTGLDEVADRVGRQRVPRGQVHVAVDVHAGALVRPRRGHGLVLDAHAVAPQLPERPERVAQEEAADDRLLVAVRRAPVVQPLRRVEVQRRRRASCAGDDGRGRPSSPRRRGSGFAAART